VSTIGLCGLDKLLSFMVRLRNIAAFPSSSDTHPQIVERLQTFVKAHRREVCAGRGRVRVT